MNRDEHFDRYLDMLNVLSGQAAAMPPELPGRICRPRTSSTEPSCVTVEAVQLDASTWRTATMNREAE